MTTVRDCRCRVLFRVVFSAAEWFGTEFRVVFSSAEGFGREFRELACISVLRNGIPSCFLFCWSVRKGRVCFFFCSAEWNSALFSLPRKGSQLNSENFLFSGTAGIPLEITTCSVNAVFRGIIFLSEIPNPMLNKRFDVRDGTFRTSTPHVHDFWMYRHVQRAFGGKIEKWSLMIHSRSSWSASVFSLCVLVLPNADVLTVWWITSADVNFCNQRAHLWVWIRPTDKQYDSFRQGMKSRFLLWKWKNFIGFIANLIPYLVPLIF